MSLRVRRCPPRGLIFLGAARRKIPILLLVEFLITAAAQAFWRLVRGKFGAVDIDAVDIDEAAVQSTRANADANHVQLNAGLPDKACGRYQSVLANILATPLKVLAPLLCSHVAPGGQLVLAGILARQADELKAAYAPWCALHVADSDDGWIMMTARF